MRKEHKENMEYQQKFTFCTNVEFSLYRDIKQYCKDKRISLTTLIDRSSSVTNYQIMIWTQESTIKLVARRVADTLEK